MTHFQKFLSSCLGEAPVDILPALRANPDWLSPYVARIVGGEEDLNQYFALNPGGLRSVFYARYGPIPYVPEHEAQEAIFSYELAESQPLPPLIQALAGVMILDSLADTGTVKHICLNRRGFIAEVSIPNLDL